jgi:hypothetical protein
MPGIQSLRHSCPASYDSAIPSIALTEIAKVTPFAGMRDRDDTGQRVAMVIGYRKKPPAVVTESAGVTALSAGAGTQAAGYQRVSEGRGWSPGVRSRSPAGRRRRLGGRPPKAEWMSKKKKKQWPARSSGVREPRGETFSYPEAPGDSSGVGMKAIGPPSVGATLAAPTIYPKVIGIGLSGNHSHSRSRRSTVSGSAMMGR